MTQSMIFAISLLLLSALFLYLSKQVILMRRQYKVPYSYQVDNPLFMATVSAQRNFIEYTPFCLILLFFLYELDSSIYLFAALNVLLVFARYMHAFGILYMEQQEKPSYIGRGIGISLTLGMILLTMLSILLYAFI